VAVIKRDPPDVSGWTVMTVLVLTWPRLMLSGIAEGVPRVRSLDS